MLFLFFIDFFKVDTYEVNDKGAPNPNAWGLRLTAPNVFGLIKLFVY